MTIDRFVYVTYIRATPEKLWDALLKPGVHPRATGSASRHELELGAGSVVENDLSPTERSAIRARWSRSTKPKAAGVELAERIQARAARRGLFASAHSTSKPNGNVTKLTVTHEIDTAQIEVHRGGIGRLAESAVELEEPARDRTRCRRTPKSMRQSSAQLRKRERAAAR